MASLLTLNRSGIISAILLGVIMLLLGGIYFFLVMVLFLVLSALVTKIGSKRKMKIGLYERGRGWKNVVANGAVPLFTVFMYWLDIQTGTHINPSLFFFAYIASVAAITADKFASEIGVLGGKPMMLLTLKMTERGRSGGVTWLGLGAALVGSFMISFGALIAFVPSNPLYYTLIIITTLVGFLGNIVDSLFGYYEEKGIGNKYSSNIACAIAGWVLEMLYLLL